MDIKPIVSLSFNRLDKTKLKPNEVAKEFKALLFEEYLKTALKPITEEKTFSQKMYWDMFAEILADEVAQNTDTPLDKVIEEYLKNQKLTKR
jgi:Rod binding domain-containing protein